MKILFISNWFPYPPINGAKIRIYNLVRKLARHHEIDLISFAQTIPLGEAKSTENFLRKYCLSINVFPRKKFDPESKFVLKDIFSQLPRSISQTYNAEMDFLIQNKIKSDCYDVVIVSEVNAPSITSFLASRIDGIPIVLDAIEVGVEKNAFLEANSFLIWMRRGLTWWRLKKYTRKLLQTCSIITVPSEEEKQNLVDIFPDDKKIEIIPHCLDLDEFKLNLDRPKPGTIVFTGSFTYQANADGIIFFLDHIFPSIKAGRPDVQLRIVGSTNGFKIEKWSADKGVHFKGLLKDVKPIISQSWLSIVPLRIGAGTRLKIIESMALGTPVVSTSRGAEGLDVSDGENILIADDPKGFSQAVLTLLENESLHRRLSVAGQDLVRKKYSSEVMAEKFEKILEIL
jgi:glycosyltransferase involved in cell wall biosynthesis